MRKPGWALMGLLILTAILSVPATAHDNYNNTPAKDCCGTGQGNEHCREAISYARTPDGNGFNFLVLENPHDPKSTRRTVSVPTSLVQRIDLFWDGRAHWCGYADPDSQDYNTYCAFVPPGDIAQRIIRTLDGMARIALFFQFWIVLP